MLSHKLSGPEPPLRLSLWATSAQHVSATSAPLAICRQSQAPRLLNRRSPSPACAIATGQLVTHISRRCLPEGKGVMDSSAVYSPVVIVHRALGGSLPESGLAGRAWPVEAHHPAILHDDTHFCGERRQWKSARVSSGHMKRRVQKYIRVSLCPHPVGALRLAYRWGR